MTPDDRFDGTVSMWLQERAGKGAPDYLDNILGRTARTRQRPGWASIERWPPMDFSATRAALPFRFPLRSLALIAILGLLLAAVVAIGIGSQLQLQRLPAPFGPAANGVIAYGAKDGDILALDVVTGLSRPLVAGPEQDEAPEFAPNGTQFIFARKGPSGIGSLMMVANADGSNVRPLTGISYLESSAWSPDSRRIAVADGLPMPPRLTVYSTDGSRPVVLPVDMTVGELRWRSDTELVFLGHDGGTHGLYVVGIDGSLPQPILPVSGVDVDFMSPVVSPNGSEIAYAKWGDSPMIHIVNIDSGVDRKVQYTGLNEGDGWPTSWSPDGKQLVFSRWNGTENHLAVGSVDGRAPVEMGPGFPDFTNGAVGLFSPDGRQIVAWYGKAPDETWLLDPAGGAGERILTDAPILGSWQRTAP